MGEWKKTQCTFCEACCGLEMLVEDNHIIEVRPDPDSPRSKNYCCRKGRSSAKFQDNPDRLDYPLKKVGDHFERISWEQAYKEIGEKSRKIIKEYGPEAFFFVGVGNAAYMPASLPVAQMKMAIGTQHAFSPAGIEFMGYYWTSGRIFGSQSLFPEPDEKNCKNLLYWGSNSYVSHNFQDSRRVIREFSEDPDRRLIVVDTRVSETARMADLHVAPKNGTDALLIRGMIAMILDYGWQDQAYLDKWVLDFDKIRPWFEGFDYRKAFEVAGVPFEQIEELVRIFCTESVGIHQDLGLFMNRHSTASSYLIAILLAVTGNLLVKGSILMHSFFAFPESDEREPGSVRSPETGRFQVIGFYPSGILATEMLSKKENRMRAMFCCSSNCACSYPDSEAVEEGIKNLELSVCVDIAMTETARLCDYVLPAKTNYECYTFTVFELMYPNITLAMKHPIIDQIAERKEDGEIFHELTKAVCDVPEVPEFLYQAAEEAVANRDRVPYMLALLGYVGEHPEMQAWLMYIVHETLGKAMGSVHKAIMWLMLTTSPHAGTDNPTRAGFAPDPKYAAMGPQVAALSQIDKVFQAAEDIPQGVTGAIMEHEDRQKYAYEAIKYPDHKLHLWCEEIENYLERLTPEKEAAALKADEDFPMLMSAGRHIDGGMNGQMRNPATYQYHKPYVFYVNPLDARRLGFEDGQEVRVTTRTSSITGPVEYDWSTSEGYILIPHHYGFVNQGVKYGEPVNRLTAADDIEDFTGNPHFRYVRCRVEAV